MQGITLTAEQEGVHLIITIGSESISMGRCMRNVNPNVEISTWGGYNHGVGWGASTYYFDNAHLKTPYMVLMTQKEYELMPKQIAKSEPEALEEEINETDYDDEPEASEEKYHYKSTWSRENSGY